MEAMQSAINEIIELTTKAGTRPTESGIPRVVMIKGSVPNHQLKALYQPTIGFVVQGSKTLSIGGRSYRLNAPSYFLLPMHVPVTGKVHPAGEERPYLSVGLTLDHSALQNLLRDIPAELLPRAAREFSGVEADAEFVDAWVRILRLMKTPRDIAALAPVYEREILYRALIGPQGWYLRQLGLRESNVSRIAQTVERLRKNYAEPIDVGELAGEAGMAVTTFHRQFKNATGLSPVQFQKQLRLLEARNLIAFEGYAVSSAAYEVGYQSASQFNREYARFFGAPPAKDAAVVRQLEYARI
jgi:AraC-like DNA-binding protein